MKYIGHATPIVAYLQDLVDLSMFNVALIIQ